MKKMRAQNWKRQEFVFWSGLAALVLFAECSIGCGMIEQPLNQNESLRLTQADVVVCTQRAQGGDVEAAMKLWQHYDFAEKNYVEGAHWKSRYDELRQKTKRNEQKRQPDKSVTVAPVRARPIGRQRVHGKGVWPLSAGLAIMARA